MSDPSVELQKAVVAALLAEPCLHRLVQKRIFDEPLPKGPYPYVSLGDGQVLGEDSDGCGQISEVTLQIDAWSQKSGYLEAKEIAAGVRTALLAPLVLDGFTVTVVQFQQSRFMRDPDGKTRHAAIQYRFLISHTS